MLGFYISHPLLLRLLFVVFCSDMQGVGRQNEIVPG